MWPLGMKGRAIKIEVHPQGLLVVELHSPSWADRTPHLAGKCQGHRPFKKFLYGRDF